MDSRNVYPENCKQRSREVTAAVRTAREASKRGVDRKEASKGMGGKEEPRARSRMRWYYWGEDSARFRRLQRLVEIYIRMLEWAVHQEFDRKLEQSPVGFHFDWEDMAALGLFAIADVDWRNSDHVACVQCQDEETGRHGCLFGGSLTPETGHGSLDPYRGDNTVTGVYFHPKIECLPSLVVFIAMKQAYAASEEDLLAVQIQWGGPPLFEHCQDGKDLLEYMRRAKLKPKELLRRLGVWKYKRIENVESARRHTYRAAKLSSTDERDKDSGVLGTSEEPTWLRAAEFKRRANRAATVEWDWLKWKRFLDSHDVPSQPARTRDGSLAKRRRLVSAGDAVCALRCAIDSGEFDEMKTDRDLRRQQIHEKIDKEFGSAKLIDEILADDS